MIMIVAAFVILNSYIVVLKRSIHLLYYLKINTKYEEKRKPNVIDVKRRFFLSACRCNYLLIINDCLKSVFIYNFRNPKIANETMNAISAS